jgi:hypothetical protein
MRNTKLVLSLLAAASFAAAQTCTHALLATPDNTATVMVFRNGQLLTAPNDYTIVATKFLVKLWLNTDRFVYIYQKKIGRRLTREDAACTGDKQGLNPGQTMFSPAQVPTSRFPQ